MAAVTVDGTVVEEEKVDLEIPQEKVDVKKADEAEPESAGGTTSTRRVPLCRASSRRP